MKELYQVIGAGWIHQTNVTGDLVKYDYTYADQFNKYPNNHEISEIRYNFCKQYASFGSVLDVGYGNGAFLNYCKNQEVVCFGNDISNYPIPSGVTFTDDISVEVDLVTFFDCIEHFPQADIENVLKTLKCNYLCISVPWCHYTDNMTLFEAWKHRKPNEHFHHFDVRGLTELMNRAEFDVIVCGSPEDLVRTNYGKLPNILTMLGKKRTSV